MHPPILLLSYVSPRACTIRSVSSLFFFPQTAWIIVIRRIISDYAPLYALRFRNGWQAENLFVEEEEEEEESLPLIRYLYSRLRERLPFLPFFFSLFSQLFGVTLERS